MFYEYQIFLLVILTWPYRKKFDYIPIFNSNRVMVVLPNIVNEVRLSISNDNILKHPYQIYTGRERSNSGIHY